MKNLTYKRALEVAVVLFVFQMLFGLNTVRISAQEPLEVFGGSDSGIIPDGGDVQANQEAAQALVDSQNQVLEDIEQFQSGYGAAPEAAEPPADKEAPTDEMDTGEPENMDETNTIDAAPTMPNYASPAGDGSLYNLTGDEEMQENEVDTNLEKVTSKRTSWRDATDEIPEGLALNKPEGTPPPMPPETPPIDTDGDGIPDDEDQFPDIPNGQIETTWDTDGDGIPDDEDPDIDGDGIPNGNDPDIDGDGIPNDVDPNPAIPDSDDDGDGIPNGDDPDIDGDGIPNDVDPHPLTPDPEMPWEDSDGDGMPNCLDADPYDPDVF